MKVSYERITLSTLSRDKRVRPFAGRRALKVVLDAMAAGHVVSMRTYYEGDDEMMDAKITPTPLTGIS